MGTTFSNSEYGIISSKLEAQTRSSNQGGGYNQASEKKNLAAFTQSSREPRKNVPMAVNQRKPTQQFTVDYLVSNAT